MVAKTVGALIGLAVVAGVGYGLFATLARGRDVDSEQTVTVKRGDLIVSVTAGGTLHPMVSLELRNEVMWGWEKRTVLSIVDEGTVITEQDVEEGMVLATFDSSDLDEQDGSFEIWFYMTEAGYANAKEAYAIQEKQNESDIALAELSAKFALIELENYLGRETAGRLAEQGLASVDLGELARREIASILGQQLSEQIVPTPVGGSVEEGGPAVGGRARQRLRELSASVQLAERELERARDKRAWSETLFDKGYRTQDELIRDQLEEQRRQVALDAATDELRLFERYTMRREAKQLYGNYTERLRELARVRSRARSRMAKAEADLKSQEARYEVMERRLDKLRDMIENCTIRAPKPGRVVYASTTDPWRRMSEPVQEGVKLWANQSIILIPDLSTLAARVKIQETDVGKIKVGQRALISVEALPGQGFSGVVKRISPVASYAEAYTNPEIKVYEIDVALDEVVEGLSPGMSATAQIIVAELRDVLYVPLAAVTLHKGGWVCVVKTAKGPERRPIETGHSTGNFVQVESGLKEGEVLYPEPAKHLGREGPDRGAGAGSSAAGIPTATVRRGHLTVSIEERGALHSLEPLELKSEVEAWATILEVVDEGTVITEKDVREGLVLVRLDSTQFEDTEVDRQISLYEAEAAYVQATENHGIQLKQNESDIALAELWLELAPMEVEAYLGSELAARLLQDGFEGVDLGAFADREMVSIVGQELSEQIMPTVAPGPIAEGEPTLGGRARQKLRQLSTAVLLAKGALMRATAEREWSQRLFEEGYVSRNELVRGRLEERRRRVALDAAAGQQHLFRRYTLQREAEYHYTEYEKAVRNLQRVTARASSRISQAEAELKSSQAVFELKKDQLDRTRDMILKCTIRAGRPGMVVYGSISDPVWYRTGQSAIRPGTGIEQNRTIIRIPDLTTLAARIHVPEERIGKVEVGQPARIVLEAAPDKPLAGKVARISPMASAVAIMADSKVYETDVALDEMPELFIPGMSATVEIIIADLEDVLSVPRQAVTQYKDHAICWVEGVEGPEPRMVETGHRSDVFMEIKSGLNAGEQVYLAPLREMDAGLFRQAYSASRSY